MTYLVALISTAEELLLHEVDTLMELVESPTDLYLIMRTLVQVVLVLLALFAAASSGVELVTDATEKATALLVLLLGVARANVLLVALLVAAGEALDEIHD
jgi:hypothetical protein